MHFFIIFFSHYFTVLPFATVLVVLLVVNYLKKAVATACVAYQVTVSHFVFILSLLAFNGDLQVPDYTVKDYVTEIKVKGYCGCASKHYVTCRMT